MYEESNKYRKLIAPKTWNPPIDEKLEEVPLGSFDNDIRNYRDTRDKFKVMKMRTNLDLMQAFNETALKFIPLYHKRVEQ